MVVFGEVKNVEEVAAPVPEGDYTTTVGVYVRTKLVDHTESHAYTFSRRNGCRPLGQASQ